MKGDNAYNWENKFGQIRVQEALSDRTNIPRMKTYTRTTVLLLSV